MFDQKSSDGQERISISRYVNPDSSRLVGGESLCCGPFPYIVRCDPC
jgi:hypothetical protein